MKMSAGTMLGLLVSDTVIVCAEVAARGGKPVVRKLALLSLEAEYSLTKPAALGAKLKDFLDEQNITSNKVVVGVPARWTISSEKELPPAGLDQVHSVLRLQGERMASADSGEMAFDYAGQVQSGRGGQALLVAMRKSQLTNIEAALNAAKLSIAAVMPWSLALAAIDRSGGPLITITPAGAEVVLRGQTSPRTLRHVSLPMNGSGLPSLTPLSSDVRRSMVMSSGAATGEATLFDAVGFSAAQLKEFSDRAGLNVGAADPLTRLGVSSESMPPAGETLGRFAPAIALALAGLQPKLLPLNFADSKLAPPAESRFGRRTIIGAAVALLIVATIVGLWINNILLDNQLEAIRAERKQIDAAVVTAQAIKDREAISTGYLTLKNRTPMLECLRQVTQNFRIEDPIWIDTITLKEDETAKPPLVRLTGRMEGRTTDPRLATELIDRIKSDKTHFEDARVRDLAGASGKQKDQSSFSANFTYGVGTPTTTGTTK